MRVRRLIRKVVRSVAPRLGAATMAVVFLTMGGGGAKSVHSASHESHPGHVIAAETTASDHTSHAPDTHAAHHGGATSEKSDETPQDPATECTCVGPCHGGTAPSEYRTTSYEVAEGEVQKVLAAPHVARIVYRNASAHILPLPTAPPSHV